MRVAITGASGFIGRYVLERLKSGSFDLVVLGRTRPVGYEGAFVETDLFRPEPFVDFHSIGATHLLHMAWYAEHGDYWSSPRNAIWAASTHHIIESFCSAGGQKVVVTGTCAEYDWSAGDCLEYSTSLAPSSIYGMAKCLARGLTEMVCDRYSVKYAWGRIFVPVGAGEDRRRLLPSLMDLFRGRRAPFPVSMSSERDFLHASDVAAGLEALLLPQATGCYNICSGDATKISEVVKMVASMFGADPDLVSANIHADPAPRVVGDNRRLQALGWCQQRSLPQVLANELAW